LPPSRSMSPVTPHDGPRTPNDRSRSPFGRPIRSATAPIRSPPSPEYMSSNLDNPFPPFPMSRPAAKSQPQQGGGYGSLGTSPVTADHMYAPVSPRTASSGGLLKRVDQIIPGPFDVNSRKADDAASDRGHLRQRSMKDSAMFLRIADAPDPMPRPSTASGDAPGHSRTFTDSSHGSKSVIPKVPRRNDYGGFGPPAGNDDFGSEPPHHLEVRSQTFPLQNESQEPSYRRPSEPGPEMRRPSTSNGPNERRPSVNERAMGSSLDGRRRPSMVGPDLTRPLPPRGMSLLRPRLDAKPGEVPPIPSNVNLAAEFGAGNPYHTPTESQSSNTSGSSQGSKASSRSSPLSSVPDRSPWNASDSTKMDSLMSEVESSITDLQLGELSSSPSPPRKMEQFARPLPRTLQPALFPPESPIDPAIHAGVVSPIPSRNPARSQAPPDLDRRPIPRRRATSKGDCKGCGKPITGKSVSSADGRLTGRYHKECFVCNTCSQPFQTATFYVIHDAPYCERHYHTLNGSLCTTCDKGIEGQYLESESKQKFHPGCLTCSDCKRNLRHGYFEMNGRVYCERDAFRRAQQGRFLGPGGPASNRMERRTTRLMMM
jgi:hypothetical protein